MLAQFARAAGYKPLVIDFFADTDTCQLAHEVRKVKSFQYQELAAAVADFQVKYPVQWVVYGSGIETEPDSLDILAGRLKLLGNCSAVYRQLEDKQAFFHTLALLHIDFPEVVFTAPETDGRWLLKPRRHQGGDGIRFYTEETVIFQHDYWQKFIAGDAMSVLFVADGVNVRLLGYQKQWSARIPGKQYFLFSGILNHAALSLQNRMLLRAWVEKLVKNYALKGLNSLDFMCCRGRCFCLEINPRPPASMMLYEDPVWLAHVRGCQGELPEFDVMCKQHKGYQVIYADNDMTVPAAICWPEWSQDRPSPGAGIRAGEPVCSVIASGNSEQQVLKQLQARQQSVLSQLKGN